MNPMVGLAPQPVPGTTSQVIDKLEERLDDALEILYDMSKQASAICLWHAWAPGPSKQKNFTLIAIDAYFCAC